MSLQKLAKGVWILDGDPISFFGFLYEIRFTVIDLGNGALWVHSPAQISKAVQLQSIPGEVKYIVSPNKLHSLFLDDWQRAFPEAKMYAAPGLQAKRPNVHFYKTLVDAPEPEWQDVIKQKIVRGSWFMEEVVFFHVPSETLILGDMIENHNPKRLGWLYRMIAKVNEILAPDGRTARIFRWTFIRRKQVREDLKEILSWNAKRVVTNHGPIVENDAQAFLQHAFAWAL